MPIVAVTDDIIMTDTILERLCNAGGAPLKLRLRNLTDLSLLASLRHGKALNVSKTHSRISHNPEPLLQVSR